MGSSTRPRPSAMSYVLCYVLWFIIGAVGLVDCAIGRQWIRELYIISGLSRWGFAFVDNSGVLFVGLVWLVVVIYLEYAFRAALNRGRLRKTFGIWLGIALVPPLIRLASGLLH